MPPEPLSESEERLLSLGARELQGKDAAMLSAGIRRRSSMSPHQHCSAEVPSDSQRVPLRSLRPPRRQIDGALPMTAICLMPLRPLCQRYSCEGLMLARD